MPSLLEFHLDLPAASPLLRPDRLHAVAARLVERAGAHHDQDKTFRAGRPRRHDDGGTLWEIGLLDDRDEFPRPSALELGPSRDLQSITVRDTAVRTTTYAQLVTGQPSASASLIVTGPLYFKRNGRDHPIPDPVLVVNSLVRRWNVHAPPAFHIEEEQRRELTSAVVLTSMNGSTTTRPDAVHDRQVGFVGTITIEARGTSVCARSLLGALVRFAEFSGIGAGTPYGCGVVRRGARSG